MSKAWHKMKRRLRILEEEAVELRASKAKHDRDVERCTAQVDSLVQKVSTIHWRREPMGGYSVMVTMNPDFLGGLSMHRDDLRFFAMRVGRQVEAQIATGHYIQSAHEAECQFYERARGPRF